MRLRMALILAMSTAIAGASAAACLDFAPNYVAPPDAAPPPPPPMDAGPDAPDVDNRPSCQQCIETPDTPGPGCHDELAACLVDPLCKSAYECILENGCLTKGTRQKVIICGLPCAEDAGIITQTEPAAVEILNVASCASKACQTSCLPDAGAD